MLMSKNVNNDVSKDSPIDLFSLYVLFSDHVMLLEGIVSFKCRLMHVQIYA